MGCGCSGKRKRLAVMDTGQAQAIVNGAAQANDVIPTEPIVASAEPPVEP